MTKELNYNDLNRDQINAKIRGIAKRGVTLQEDTQFIALATLRHAQKHDDDFSLCTNLLNALPNSAKKTDLIKWFMKNAPMVLVTKETKTGDKVKVFKKNKKADAPSYNFVQAEATPYYHLTKEEKALETLTIEKFVATEMASIERKRKLIKEGKYGNDNQEALLGYLDSQAAMLKHMAV